jgi:tRNA A37 N6-isopentenylltransferase MiaA
VKGEMDLVAAIADTQQATRNYAKRQVTWFRHEAGVEVWAGSSQVSPKIA